MKNTSNNINFRVSVIVPVYNAEKFIEKAVISAINQEEVFEVIVVNDGSTDKTGKILSDLKKQFSNLFICEHKNKINKGRAASRNLGINKAKYEFIAFLDADDYYTPNRFKNDKEVFSNQPDADGVYNAIGVHFYRDPISEDERRILNLTTISIFSEPASLFHIMEPKGKFGRFSGDGLTVKKNIFKKSGLFNEDLEVAEDTELWIKMSLAAKLYAGQLDQPVACRGVHNDNVFILNNEKFYLKNKFKAYKGLLNWSISKNMSQEVIKFFWEQSYNCFIRLNKNITMYDETKFWLKTLISNPAIVTNKKFIRSNPLIKWFHRNKI